MSANGPSLNVAPRISTITRRKWHFMVNNYEAPTSNDQAVHPDADPNAKPAIFEAKVIRRLDPETQMARRQDAHADAIYAGMSPTVLYDAMAESANRLIGSMVQLAMAASTEEERDRLRAQIRQVRDERQAVDADDRQAQLTCIRQWEAAR